MASKGGTGHLKPGSPSIVLHPQTRRQWTEERGRIVGSGEQAQSGEKEHADSERLQRHSNPTYFRQVHTGSTFSAHGLTISNFPANPDPAIFRSTCLRRMAVAPGQSGIRRTHAVDKRTRIAPNISIEHDPVVTHINVVGVQLDFSGKPIGKREKPARRPGAAAGSTPSVVSAGGWSSSTGSTPPGRRSTTATCGTFSNCVDLKRICTRNSSPTFGRDRAFPLRSRNPE